MVTSVTPWHSIPSKMLKSTAWSKTPSVSNTMPMGMGEQGWLSDESTPWPPTAVALVRIPEMASHVGLFEFVVGSRPCTEGFSPDSHVFLPPQKPTRQIPTRPWYKNPPNEFMSSSWCGPLGLNADFTFTKSLFRFFTGLLSGGALCIGFTLERTSTTFLVANKYKTFFEVQFYRHNEKKHKSF